MDPKLVVLTLRLLLAVLWLAAAAGKLRNLEQFAADVQEYRLLPPAVAAWWGRVLPILELALGLALLLGIAPRAAAVGTCALLLLFAGAMGLAILRRLRIRCHCFGELGRSPVTWAAVARNLLLAGGALLVALEPRQYWSAAALFASGGTAEPSLVSLLPVWCIAVGALMATHALVTAYSVFRVSRGRRPDDFLRF